MWDLPENHLRGWGSAGFFKGEGQIKAVVTSTMLKVALTMVLLVTSLAILIRLLRKDHES